MWVLLIVLLFSDCVSNETEFNYTESGKASYYANLFIGRTTANGEIFSQDSLSAAHKTLPFGTKVLVTNVENNKSIIVYINDRGPFVRNRIIDLTRRGADSLNMLTAGLAKVEIKAFIEDEAIAEELNSNLHKN